MLRPSVIQIEARPQFNALTRPE